MVSQPNDDDRPTREGGRILEDVVRFLERFIVLPDRVYADALALWIFHSHAIEAADCTPVINVFSPTPSSGKTLTAEVCELLVREPLRTGDASMAAMFREIERTRPTLFLDEVDTKFGARANGERAEDLRGLINNGFNRGTPYLRCDGRNHETKRFDVFAAKMLIGIVTDLPDTIRKRSIPIPLQRKARHEVAERFRRRRVLPQAEPIREAVSEWAEANLQQLRNAEPDLPDALSDRQQDAWEPLLAIADAAGGEWPDRARQAAVRIHAEEDEDEATVGVLLLQHVRDAIGAAPHIATVNLLEALIQQDGAPWARWWGRDVEDGKTRGPAAKLARILKPFGVRSKKVWIQGRALQGFSADSFRDCFNRYLPPENSEGRKSAGQSPDSVAAEGAKQDRDQGSSDPPTLEGGWEPEGENSEEALTVPAIMDGLNAEVVEVTERAHAS